MPKNTNEKNNKGKKATVKKTQPAKKVVKRKL